MARLPQQVLLCACPCSQHQWIGWLLLLRCQPQLLLCCSGEPGSSHRPWRVSCVAVASHSSLWVLATVLPHAAAVLVPDHRVHACHV